MTLSNPEIRTLLKRAGLAILAGLLVVSGLAVGFNAWVVESTRDRVYQRVEDVPAKHVAIVLGARIYSRRGEPSPALKDRLQAALELYLAGKVEKILVSGDNGSPYYDEVTVMRRWLIRRGADPEDVVRDHAGFRTHDTMQRAQKIFGVDEAIVCTQRFHLNRSLFLADAAGIDAVGVVVDRRADPNAGYNALRESAARVVAVLDAHVWHREPRYWGPKEDLVE